MAGTCFTDLNAIALTGTAKAAGSAKGVDLTALVTLAKAHATELSALLKQIESVHPSTGADLANYNQLVTVIGELA
jgi:hypothetical protein